MTEWITPVAVHSKCGEDVGSEAIKAIDGDTSTYWEHATTCFHWIIFDMGETKTITKIRLYQSLYGYLRWGVNHGLTVYVGDDPADLGDAVWDGILDDAGWQESGSFSKKGRYIKLVSKADDTYQDMLEFALTVAPPVEINLPMIGGIAVAVVDAALILYYIATHIFSVRK